MDVTLGLLSEWLLFITPVVGVTVLACLLVLCKALETRTRREELAAEVERRLGEDGASESPRRATRTSVQPGSRGT